MPFNFNILEVVKIIRDYIESRESGFVRRRKERAALTLGPDFLLWAGLQRAGVEFAPQQWEEEGVIELVTARDRIIESIRLLGLQIDFPPEEEPSCREDYIFLPSHYHALIMSEPTMQRERLAKLYNYGFTLGMINVSLIPIMIVNNSEKKQEEKTNLYRLCRTLVEQGMDLNLSEEIIEESQELERRIREDFISPGEAERICFRYKQLLELVKKGING